MVTFFVIFFGVGCDQVGDRLREKLGEKDIEQTGSSAGGADTAPIRKGPEKAAVSSQEEGSTEAVNPEGGPRGKVSSSEMTDSRSSEANKLDQSTGLKTYRREGESLD